MRMRPDDFAQNLGFLCSFHPSIAEVCRRLRINRQQFNKYLSGQVRPSRHNLRRICEFFGVTEAEVFLEHNRFAEIFPLRRPRPASDTPLEPLRHLDVLYQASGNLDRYVGYYFRYFYSFGYARRIIKSLARVSERDGRYFWKNIECIPSARDGHARTTTKYSGIMLLLGDRIFIVEYETLLRNTVTQAILYPSYSTRIDFLVGVQTGAPVTRGRKPAASAVLLEYLGRHVDARRALKQSGIFDERDRAIDPKIRALIANRISDESGVLEIEQV